MLHLMGPLMSQINPEQWRTHTHTHCKNSVTLASYQQPKTWVTLLTTVTLEYNGTPSPLLTLDHLLSLEHNHFVGQQVLELQLSSPLDDFRVFAHQQPADVGEEEAPRGVVRVAVCLRVLVVHPVIPGPLVDIILWTEEQTDATRYLALATKTAITAISVRLCGRLPEMPWS